MLYQCFPPMIEVSIPSLEREEDESGKQRKLFRVEILFNGRKHFVLRRHSEFQTLHRKLKKIAQLPDFPSKRNPHLRTKPLEQRRQELEDYIQDILYQNKEVPQELLDFLQVKHFHSASKIYDNDDFNDSQTQGYTQLLHQRVVGFCTDPYLLESNSELPDIVLNGVLQGFYPRDAHVSFKACPKPKSSSLTSASSKPAVAPFFTVDRVRLNTTPESNKA